MIRKPSLGGKNTGTICVVTGKERPSGFRFGCCFGHDGVWGNGIVVVVVVVVVVRVVVVVL